MRMPTLNRRKFFQFSVASLLAEKVVAPFLGEPQRGALRRLQQLSEASPYRSTLQKLEAMTGTPVTDWKWHADDLPHPEDPALDDSHWEMYRPPPPMVGKGAVWFRTWVETPPTMGGYKIQGLPIRLNLRFQGPTVAAVRVFSNGSLVEMTPPKTQQPILLMNHAKPGQKFLIAAYSPVPGGVHARLEVEYPLEKSNPQTMLEEISAVQAASKGFPDGQREREAQLRAVVQTIDFGALEEGDTKAFDQSLAHADQKMQRLAEWMKQFTIRAVGNSHIDLAWKWPWTESVEIVRNTFGTALELMQEYSGLHYAQSSAQDFLWLEEKYPDLFQEIHQRVKDGRWELVGGMWCEPDLNMPCGESLVRQLLTGKGYFQKKFGVDVKIGWNPDSFGYSWQLPQIYKRSGIDCFVTQKMKLNDTTPFPYKLFHWESPDGSRVLTYFPHGYGNGIDLVECSEFIREDTRLCSGFQEQMLLFGMGDHGGGPTRQMLDRAVRWQKSPKAAFPNFKFSTVQQFFDDVHASLSQLKLPVWRDELYLQFHRGTYTTQAESKRRMRSSEVLMLNAEKFSSLAMLNGRPYPQSKFEDCWRRVCLEQFHDQMAGSGIHVIYQDEAENLEFVRDACLPELHGSLDVLTARVDTHGPGIPVIVFNSLSWERTGVVEVHVQFPGPVAKVEVRDPAGQVMPSAMVSRDEPTRTVRMRFLAPAVPAIGYKVFRFISTEQPREAASTLKVKGLGMENEFLSLEVHPKTGCVTRLFNKTDGRNILSAEGQGNLLATFVDKPSRSDAWNIDLDYQKQKTELLNAAEVKLVENTPIRAVIRVRKSFQKSSFVQDICLYPGIARADVHMHADWHEQHVMLKVAFPLDIAPLKASYEIPYGIIERPATPHIPGKPPVPFTLATGVQTQHEEWDPLLAQEAEFEVCALQWGDLSENGRGFSLLSRDKYGYDTVEPGTIRLTLLRSPTFPDPQADQGPHDFTYAMYPHVGGWREAGTQLQAYELNYPLLGQALQAHEGSLPAAHSFVQIEPRNVILTAIKKAEDDDALIFRFYEFEGKDAQVLLRLPQAATSAAETNLMEKEETRLAVGSGGHEVRTAIGHYEIKTVKVSFPNVAGSRPPRRV